MNASLRSPLRLAVLALPVVFAVSGGAAAAGEPHSTRPNVLFIMSDDHAAHAIGAYGGRLAALDPTPNIDRLARDGVRMANCFVTNSICTPSRASIITGQYSHVHGSKGFANGIEPERQTLALLMKEAGYETAMAGKWHLIHEPAVFDYYCVLPGQGSYFNPIFCVRGDDPWPDSTIRVSGYDSAHSSDAVTNISLKWLKGRRDKSRPFFLMHHFKAPHDNFENAERYDWLYEDVDVPEPESLWNRKRHGPAGGPLYGTSVSKRNERRNMGHHMFVDPSLADENYTRTAYQRYLKKYLRCVRGVDDNVGRILDYLDQSGQLDNTVIIYTADQGFMLGEHDYIDKRWMYEESLRMPFIVRYPKSIPAGTTSDAIVNNVDFAPTILAMAGVEAPDSMQGRSFLGILEGKPAPDDWPTASYYRYWLHMAHHDNPAHYGIRTSDFKLIFFYGLPLDAKGAVRKPTPPYWELYDLRKDPHEMNNVYHDPAYADVAKRLKAELLAIKERVGDGDEKYPELIEVRRAAW